MFKTSLYAEIVGMILLTGSVLRSQGQNFEGLIVYHNEFKSKTSKIRDSTFKVELGDKQEYYIKNNNYKSIYNGKYLKFQLYKGDLNKAFILAGHSDTIREEDYNKGNRVLNCVINEDADTVMNVPCNELILITVVGITHYYFNPKYQADSLLFKNHSYSNWNYILSKTNSLPMKIIYENEQFISTSTAIQIVPMHLKETFFDLPKSYPVVSK